MEREKFSFILGLALLAAGIIILLLVLASTLSLVANPSSFLEEQLDGGGGTPPRAFFAWSSNGTTVDFEDMSSAGSSPIATWEWDFGDGRMASTRDAAHTYAQTGDYIVRLTVLDENGLQAAAGTQINVMTSGSNGGSSEGDGGFSLSNLFLPFGLVILTIGLYIVVYLVGASLVKAGWNLIRPRPETIRIRLKPRQLEKALAVEAEASKSESKPATAEAPPPPPPPP